MPPLAVTRSFLFISHLYKTRQKKKKKTLFVCFFVSKGKQKLAGDLDSKNGR
jgi:hypothetical protein